MKYLKQLIKNYAQAYPEEKAPHDMLKFLDEEAFEFEIDYDKPELTHYRLNIKDTHFNRAKPPRYVYHKTRHKNYRSIVENGLEIRGNEVYSDTPMYNHPSAIFVSSEQDFFGWSNDDEWRIDTTMIDNKWWQDYNLYHEEQQKKSFLTYEPIPFSAISINSITPHNIRAGPKMRGAFPKEIPDIQSTNADGNSIIPLTAVESSQHLN